MNRRIGLLAIALATFGSAACSGLAADRSDLLGRGQSPILIGDEVITLKSRPLGQRIRGYTCGPERTLVCADNGFWSRCRCSGR